MKRRWGPPSIIVVIVVCGFIAGTVSMAATATVYKNSLRTRIHTIAEALDSQRITELDQAGPNAATQEGAINLQSKLASINAANADSRFVYIVSRDNVSGTVSFLADSGSAGSNGHTLRGQILPEASSKLKSIFDNGRTIIEGPTLSGSGNWLSALSPIIDERTYRITAVVGMDVPATTYGLLLGLAGGIPLLLSLFAAAIVYVRRQIRRRHHEHIQFRAEMLSIASHELRTPLTGLLWSEQNLLSRKLNAKARREVVEGMYDSTRQLQESIEDVLQLASIGSGKSQRLFIKEVDLHDVIDDVIATQQLAADHQKVTFTLSAAWPKHLMVSCDVPRIKRVFNNLVSNAIKYSMPQTVVTIGYSRSKAGRHVISIQDHGIGIPDDEQVQVWRGFYRAKNAAEHDIDGTGMGLYLARRIVEQHGGRMRLESKVGKGTTVFVELED
jgi:signal transduction histidine kinase